jgi:hypothetical protein
MKKVFFMKKNEEGQALKKAYLCDFTTRITTTTVKNSPNWDALN